MRLLSADGQSLVGADVKTLPQEAVTEADVQSYTGGTLHTEVVRFPHERSPMKFSLWVLGGIFALLGAAVALRRPDLQSARMFAFFAGFVALAVAVIPSAGEPLGRWATLIEALAVAGAGATCLPFVLSFLGSTSSTRESAIFLLFAGLGLILSSSFIVSMITSPSAYEILRPALLLFVSFSVLGAVGLLAFKSISLPSSPRTQQARITLYGMLFGTLPLISLTLIPEALGQGSLLPVYLTILALGIIPASFAYAILQHQMWGIRRLVHRGMVYGIVSFVLLLLVLWGLTAEVPFSYRSMDSAHSVLLTAIFLVGGIVLFFPLRGWAHWLVDRLLYRDMIDYQAFVDMVRGDLLTSGHGYDMTRELTERLAKALELESTLLFLGPELLQARLIASAGERAEDVVRQWHAHHRSYIQDSSIHNVIALSWESDSLILATLKVSDKYLGYMLLGPKKDGEVFLREEQRLIATVAPLLALAIDKSILSEELSELNQRLVKVEEVERARIAADLHDGPLQKAIVLTWSDENFVIDTRNLARQIVGELREIASRLRPAILDDLGLIPSLEWLLNSVSQRSAIRTHLMLRDISRQDRFPPDIELALFRVAQEATNNVVKHAKADYLELSLTKETKSLVLRVVDNGVGFLLSSIDKGRFGITGMRERIRQLNGSFDIHSEPELGTTIVVRISALNRQGINEGKWDLR